MLNAPSYTVPDDDIGFITRVYPGVRKMVRYSHIQTHGHGQQNVYLEEATGQWNIIIRYAHTIRMT